MALDDLYRELIIDHYSHPHNKGTVDPADITVDGANPLCGDELTFSVRLRDGQIDDVRFEGHGCSISLASASMMTDQIKGKTLEETRGLVEQFKAMMQGKSSSLESTDLAALQGVRKFPVRVKCATLAWVSIDQAIDDYQAGGRVPVRTTTETEE